MENKLSVAGGEVDGGNGVTGWWALRRALDVMSTGCYINANDKSLNSTLRLVIQYILTKLNLNKN